MAISGIGGQSGLVPAQAAAQYTKNATAGINFTGKAALEGKDVAKELPSGNPRTPVVPPPGGGTSAAKSGAEVGAQKSATANDSSASRTTYDPKDTNRDGQVYFQEELAHAAKQYSVNSTVNGLTNKLPPPNGVNGQEPQASSISLFV